jgi:carboxypeptidase Taq
VEKFFRAINKVEPALIRVDADEVTYNLHIFVRFELEQDLIAGKLMVRDLPDAWNSKYESYLGVTPPDNSQGVLQDVHWSGGMFGYFPTYTLGNILSVQLWEVMLKEAGIVEQITRGRFQAVKEWLNNNVHVHGAKFTTLELAERVTGSQLTVGPYLNYIERKYKELYGI